ncbi:hypothetical protein ASC84_04725 [Acinetobacter sp. Root1280]|uniref:hypothetical protein n=1 Tax=Acinetobacter sp. Root1280 TaxID=1736444 RepID=UPI0006FDD8EB|nr:hypothetical protein [Acinetobacter sp. Root1280]KQW98060.1 hypothetical protein ASC84_04725 [Acinetobacter sp. Root1280]
MKKILLCIFCAVNTCAWAELPKQNSSCKIVDQKYKFAYLVVLGSLCSKDENSIYDKSLNTLFLKNQKKCKLSREQIDPTDEKVMNAYDGLLSLTIEQQRIRCRASAKTIKTYFSYGDNGDTC